MTEEQLAWNSLKPSLEGRIKATRIENMLGEATPDINALNRRGTTFWVELKALKSWPVRATTAPLKNKFEKGQLSFLRSHISWKGKGFVLLRVASREWYLLNPAVDLEACTKEGIIDASFAIGKENVISFLESI
uniref:DNA helicase n=1 Tax=Serratia phage Spe5P4 TaxID=3159438 RepID=A0AAU7VGS3_9CAUD